MTVVQTVLIYVLIPAAAYGLIALLTLWPRGARSERYRPGQQWTYDPVWWNAKGVLDAHHIHVANPVAETSADASVRTARGGARGGW